MCFKIVHNLVDLDRPSFMFFLVILEQEYISSNLLNYSIKMFNLIVWLTVEILFLMNLYLVRL